MSYMTQTGYIQSRHLLQYWPSLSNLRCRQLFDVDRSTRSSAYNKQSIGEPLRVGLSGSLTLVGRSFIYKLKRRGLRTSSCLTPILLWNDSVMTLSTLTQLSDVWYILSMTFKKFPFIPFASNLYRRPSLHTVSYAFLKSTKPKYTYIFH